MNKKTASGKQEEDLFVSEQDVLKVTCYFTLKHPEKLALQSKKVFFFTVLNSDRIILENFSDYIVSELLIKGFCQIQSSHLKWDFIHLKLLCKTHTSLYIKRLKNISGRFNLNLNEQLHDLEFNLKPLLGQIPKTFCIEGIPSTVYGVLVSERKKAMHFDSPLACITRCLINPIDDENNQYRFIIPSTELIIGFDFIISVQLLTYYRKRKRNLFYRVFLSLPLILLLSIVFPVPPARSAEKLSRAPMAKYLVSMSASSLRRESSKNPPQFNSTLKSLKGIKVTTQSSRNIKKTGLVNIYVKDNDKWKYHIDYWNLENLLSVEPQMYALTSHQRKELKNKIYTRFLSNRHVNTKRFKEIQDQNESRDFFLNNILNEKFVPILKFRHPKACSLYALDINRLDSFSKTRLDQEVNFQNEPEDSNLRLKGKLASLINVAAIEQFSNNNTPTDQSIYTRYLIDKTVIHAVDLAPKRIKRAAYVNPKPTDKKNPEERGINWTQRPRSRAIQDNWYTHDTIKWAYNECDLFVFNQLRALDAHQDFGLKPPDWNL